MAITRPRMSRIPHPLRWLSIWFLTLVVGFGVSSWSIVQYQHQQCVTFRTEEAPAAFDSFGRFLGRRGGLPEEEIDAALEQFHEQLEKDLPASAC